MPNEPFFTSKDSDRDRTNPFDDLFQALDNQGEYPNGLFYLLPSSEIDNYFYRLEQLALDEYWKTVHGIYIRRTVFYRDRNRCRLCNSCKSLRIHFRCNHGKLHDARNAITLCSQCWNTQHGVDNKIPKEDL